MNEFKQIGSLNIYWNSFKSYLSDEWKCNVGNVFFPSKLLGLLLLLALKRSRRNMENIPNKIHITAPETISTCTMITFPHSQRALLIVHVLSIAKHVGQMNLQQQTDIYERCLHAADGSLLIRQVHIFTLLSYSSLYIYINSVSIRGQDNITTPEMKYWKQWRRFHSSFTRIRGENCGLIWLRLQRACVLIAGCQIICLLNAYICY